MLPVSKTSISTVGTCCETCESRNRIFPYQLLLVLTAMSEQTKAICHCVKNDQFDQINNFHSMLDHFKKKFLN